MARKPEETTAKHHFRHRSDAEWLTYDICMYYIEKARDIKERSISDSRFNNLCHELMQRCDITEVQAINIINGFHVNEYVAIYDCMKNPERIKNRNDDRIEYLQWLSEKGDKKGGLDDYSLLDEE